MNESVFILDVLTFYLNMTLYKHEFTLCKHESISNHELIETQISSQFKHELAHCPITNLIPIPFQYVPVLSQYIGAVVV